MIKKCLYTTLTYHNTMKKKKDKPLMNGFEMFFAIEIGKILIKKVSQEMGFKDEDNFNCYLDQIEMDNKGLGINGKVKEGAR